MSQLLDFAYHAESYMSQMDESTKLGSPQRNYKTLPLTNDEKEVQSKQGQSNSEQEMKNSMAMRDMEHKEEIITPNREKKNKKNRVPRRVIHFSDGVIEEFSTDSEEEEERRKAEELEQEKKKKALIDPKTLTWIPWAIYYTWFMGSTALTYCDFLGEKLAWWFGITSPKYYYELQEFERMKEEEAEEEKRRTVEEHGWSDLTSPEIVTTTNVGENVSTGPTMAPLEGLNPCHLDQASSISVPNQREVVETTMEQELHTVDFDPESQTKHY